MFILGQYQDPFGLDLNISSSLELCASDREGFRYGTVICKQTILELEQASDVPDYGKYETIISFLPVAPAYDFPRVSVLR